jgi:hypothetical protein
MNWDPTKWDQDPNKWGSAGLIWNGGKDPRGLTDGRSGNGWNFDPRYMQQNQHAGSEGNGGQTYYEPTDHFNKLFDNGNQIQVRDIKRLKDQNAVKWGGDEVGWTTSKDNYTDDTDWVDKAFEYGGMALVGGIPAMHALTAGGLLGGAGNSSGMMGGMGYEGAGMIAPGMEGVAAAESALINAGGVPAWALEGMSPTTPTGGTGGDLPHGTEMPNTYPPGVDPSPLGMTPGAGASGLGGLLGGGIEGLISGIAKNPLQALSLFGLGRGLLGGGNTTAPTGGGSSGGGGLLQLPKGKRGAWTPNAHTAGQISNFKWAGK